MTFLWGCRNKLVLSSALACDCRLFGQASGQACFLKRQPGVIVDCAHRQERCPTKLALHAQGSPTTRSLRAVVACRHVQQAYSTLLLGVPRCSNASLLISTHGASALDMTSLSLEAHKKPPSRPPPRRQLQQAYSGLPPKNAGLLWRLLDQQEFIRKSSVHAKLSSGSPAERALTTTPPTWSTLAPLLLTPHF